MSVNNQIDPIIQVPVSPPSDLFPVGDTTNSDGPKGDGIGDMAPVFESQVAGQATAAAEATSPAPATEQPGPMSNLIPDSASEPGELFASQVGDAQQSFSDQAADVAPESTMQGQLETILNQDNALFDWAAGQGASYANSRGLQNSDIGAEAVGQAIFQSASQIAQFDASVFADRAAMALQGDINSRLQLEQFGYNWNLSAQDNLHNMQQLALQGDINAQLALQNFGFDTALMAQDFGFRLELAEVDLQNALKLSAQDNTQWIERMGIDHANNLEAIAAGAEANQSTFDQQFTLGLQQNYLNAVTNRNTMLSAEIQNIYAQEGLTPAQQANAVNVARQNYENDIALIAAMYTSNPHWDPDWDLPINESSTGPGGSTSPPVDSLPPPGTGGGDTTTGGTASGTDTPGGLFDQAGGSNPV